MPLNDTSRRSTPVAGNGVTRVFPFAFRMFDAADVGFVTADADGVETTHVNGVDFTVALNPDQENSPGGAVTFPANPSDPALGGGNTAVVVSRIPYDQPTELPTGGRYEARTVENMVNRAVALLQQILEVQGRTLTLGVTSDPGISTRLPTPVDGRVLGWGGSPVGLRNIDITTFASVIAYGNARTLVANGGAASYTLAVDPGSVHNTRVAVGGVVQTPGVDYNVVGTLLTPTTPWPVGVDNVVISYGEALPVGTQSADQVSFQRAGGNAAVRDAQDKMREVVSVLDTAGVTGDGVTDDTAGLIAAEADAFARGAWLKFPAGRTFLVSTGLTFRVPVIGAGATLRCTASAESLVDAVLFYDSVADPLVFGLTIDCNNTRRGLRFDACTGVRVDRVEVVDALFGGVACYDCVDVSVANSKVNGVIYPTPSTGHAADGFYFGSCVGVVVAYCRAKDFERIGFVTEGDPAGVRSDRVLYVGCHAEDALNCDDSATEFNAAFWHEHTNDIAYLGCTGTNIASGVGQTSGRVRGFVAAVGSDRRCKFNYVACGVNENDAPIPAAFTVQGTSQFPSANYEGCYARDCINGLSTLGGIGALTIEQFDVDDITSGSGQGAIVLDISANALSELHIDGLRVSNKTYHADAADINFFSSHAGLLYTLKNAYGISHIMRQVVASVSVEDASVSYGSGSYASFSAAKLVFGRGVVLTPRAGATDVRLFQEFQMTNGTVEFASGSTLSGGGSLDIPVAGASVNVFANGATFDGVTLSVNMTGSFVHQFTGCRVLNIPAVNGFYRSNTAAATKQVLIATGTYFAATNVANTPLRKNTNNPTNSVLQGNTYNTTNLHTFDGGVTAANNTAV